MMKSLSIQSPAKLNLYLRVTGKLPGGFHRIFTLFHRISLADQLHLKKRFKGFRLICSNPALPVGEDNLVSRAYRLLQRRFPDLGGVSVRLIKRIPLAGGLGGGSSNAASFLLGMKRIYRLPLTGKTLMQMGSQLGSDVPFFLYQTNQAIGEGRGEIIRRLRSKKRWFVLLLAEEGLSTKNVYLALSKGVKSVFLTKIAHIARIRCHSITRLDAWDATSWLQNDLEHSACQLKPSIREQMALAVQLGSPAVAMSGSGPTIFSMFDARKEAAGFARRLRHFISSDRIKVCHTF